MQCFHPVMLRGPDYSGPVPCNKCFACQSNRRADWFMRIKYEMLSSLYSYTVTLTYDNDHLPVQIPHYFKDHQFVSFIIPGSGLSNEPDYWYHPFDLDHVQRYLKRLRKKYKLRYFGVAEYGGKRGRPHYHIIFFFRDVYDRRLLVRDFYKEWWYGSQITVDETDDNCIGYTLKYCIKPFTSTDPNPKIFMSKKPFIGDGYMKDSTVNFLRKYDSDYVNTICGYRRLSRIYRDKIYDDIMKDRNRQSLLASLEEQKEKDSRYAFERGITYDELIKLRRKAFTERCLKQIKKKSL